MFGSNESELKELRNYRLLVALVANSKIWQAEVFKEHYDPVALKFVDALSQTLPSVSRANIFWSFSFFLGSLVSSIAETGRIDRLSKGLCNTGDLYEARKKLVQYSALAFVNLPQQIE